MRKRIAAIRFDGDTMYWTNYDTETNGRVQKTSF